MRILLITQYWAPENGVPQRRWAWLSRVLEQAGHEILVVAPPPHYLRDVDLREWFNHKGYRSRVEARPDRESPTVIRSGYIPGGPSITQKALNQLAVAFGGMHAILKPGSRVRDFDPDLVIGTVPALPTALVAAVTGAYFKIPYIIDLRDAWPELLTVSDRWNIATGKPSIRQRLLRHGPLQIAVKSTDVGLKALLARADAIISTSERLTNEIAGASDSRSRAWTVRNVFPAETLIEKAPVDSCEPAKLNVLYAGTLGRAQNLLNALYAAEKAKRSGVTVRLRFVGAGAAKSELIEAAERLGVDAVFENRRGAEFLTDCYKWADTALVHLTDWPPLEKAVPSKTYELMEQGIHISAVVSGETADLIRSLKAGDVVAPEDPCSLADLWVGLARERKRLVVSNVGRKWVRDQRTIWAPEALIECVNWVEGKR